MAVLVPNDPLVDPVASLTLNHLTVSDGNLFGQGGGVSNSGTLIIANSTFSGNASSDVGGGVWNGGTATITNSAFSGNSSGYGGGVSNDTFGVLTVTNSTFSGNSAYVNGGGIANAGTATLRNTIVANNTTGGNCFGTITNGGNNIDSGTTCGWGSASGSMSSTDPMLGALASNGGPTQTFALFAGSPAIDGVTVGAPNGAPATDQRGVARPQGVRYDIGSYEYEAGVAPPTVVSVTRADANPTGAASVHFTVTFSESVTGVNVTDFTATMGGGVSGATVSGTSGSGSVYTVTVATGTGSGTLRLDVVDDDTILNAASQPLGGAGAGNGNFTTGEVYSVRPYFIYLPLVIR